MRPQARVEAAVELLDAIITAARDNGAAADTLIARYFKDRRYAGSKDRRAVRDLVYRAIRTYGEPPSSGRAAMLGLAATDPELADLFDGSPHAPSPIVPDETVAVASPVAKWLRSQLCDAVDDAELLALTERAPLDLRVNVAKAQPEEVRSWFSEAVPLAGVPAGLRLPHGSPVETHPGFADGAFEIQDGGSQIIALACGVKAGMTVVDLCAGAGGKTLALAAAMDNRGRLIACDAIRSRMTPLEARAQRAGATIEKRLLHMRHEGEALADLADAADIVLVDAPCSGTGTWRRNPEARWRIDQPKLSRFAHEQARLLDIGGSLVAPGGALVYAVCALTKAEGPGQIDAFLSRHSGWNADTELVAGRSLGQGRLLTPLIDGCDGFFFARLVRDGS